MTAVGSVFAEEFDRVYRVGIYSGGRGVVAYAAGPTEVGFGCDLCGEHVHGTFAPGVDYWGVLERRHAGRCAERRRARHAAAWPVPVKRNAARFGRGAR